MEDKGVDFPKLPPESEPPSANRSIVQSFLSRQSGVKSKSNSNIVPTELQWAAEDKMIMRTHEEHKCELPDVPRSTFLMVFSPDGKKVASTHGNHNVYVTDVTSGKNIKTLSGHPRTPWCIAFHPSSNQILASGCLGGQVRVWDLSGGSEIWMAESATVIASLAFHPVDRMLVIGTYNELHFWDWSQPEPFAKCFTSNQREKIRYVAFDPLGHKLITGIANAPQRAPSQWDRVAAPQPPPQNNQLDPWGERRITICYRYMVEQYEQLVQRYCDLSRARSTLTMDRGTDPMELEDDSSNSHRTAQNEAQARPSCRSCESQRPTAPLTSPSTSGNRVRFSLGTDETSASHSSTNFLTPPEASESDESSQSLPFLTPEETPSPNGTTNSFSRISNTPRRNPRFDITLPSFSSFRTRSSSVPSTNSTGAADSTSTCTPNLGDNSMTRTPSRVSLSRDSINFSNTRSDTQSSVSSPSEPVQNNSGGTTNNLRERLRNLMFTLRNRRNTEVNTVNSSVDSEFDEPEGNPEPRQASQSDTEEHRSVSNTGYDSTNNFNSPSRHSRNYRDNSSRRLSEAFSVSQLRSQFHRLQSVYENRNSNAPTAHVFSPETQTAERRLLNRINEILEQPLPEPRARRLFVSRHSAFRPRVPQPPSRPAPQPPPDILRGVRYGIQLLSQHIDNMQRLCRARLEILQLQQIRRMWEDLQSQIYALHGAVRDSRDFGTGEEREASASTSQPPVRTTTSTTLPTRPTTSTSLPPRPTPNADLLTDDDSDGADSNGELHWRQRRTPQVSGRRNIPRTLQPRAANKYPPLKRSRLMLSKMNSNVKRMTLMQHVYARRQPQASSSTQEDGGDMSSSQVSGETSTGTSEERDTVRGVKRKSRDSDPLFSPRPSTASQGQSTSSASSNSSSGICTNVSANTRSSGNAGSSSNASSSTNAGSGARNVSASNIAAVMRDTILQLENMVWRHRQATSQRNPRFSRFTRQPEERRLRNLWDTESSHESSRDDQSEGESTQQSTPEQNTPVQNTQGNEHEGSEWSICNTRIRARQVLLLMVDSLTQFFENDNLTNRASNEALNDRINDLFVLLQLALNLTDLLLAQLFHSRRELDGIYRYRNRTMAQEVLNNRRLRRMQDRYIRHAAMRRSIRRFMACPRLSLPSLILANSTPPTPASRRPPVASQAAPASRTLRSLHPHSNVRYPYHSPARPVVPVVRVNDLPAPPPENNIPRFRPHSPPPISPHPIVVPARFLHPGRYIGSGFVFDEFSTSEDSSPQERNGDFFFMRGGYGSSSVILTDTPMSPQHRIQAWDFSEYKLPDLESAEKNIVVTETKIHNDASVDVSRDGRLLVALLPSGRVSMTTLLGIYSLQWDTLGQLLYTTSFEQSIVSVSLSPTARHLVVGLASRRVTLVSSDRLTYAQVFRLEGATPGRRAPLGARGRLVHLRDLDLSRHFGFMSLNCIRWAPNPGQGLVYGTNTGQLKILR